MREIRKVLLWMSVLMYLMFGTSILKAEEVADDAMVLEYETGYGSAICVTRPSALLEAWDDMSGGTYECSFESIPNENNKYTGYIGKAIRFKTGSQNLFYKISQANTYAYTVNFQLYSSNGTEVDLYGANTSVKENMTETSIIKLDADTYYYLAMYTKNQNSSETGIVSVSMTECVDDFPDSAQEAQKNANIVLGTPINGNLEGYSDNDYFCIKTGNKKASYKLELCNQTVEYLYIYLYDSNGILTYSSKTISKAATKILNFNLKESSVYFLRICGSTENYMGAYSFLINMQPDDAGDTAATSSKLKIENSIQGQFQGDEDIDVYSFCFGKAVIGSVRIKNLDTLNSLKYKIMNEEGKSLSSGTLGAGLTVTKTISGLEKNRTYYVQLSGDADISYNVTALYVRHNIKYILNGGKNNKKNPNTYIESKGLKLYSPVRKGYLFKGWFSDKALHTKVEKIPSTQQENISLYAKWEKVAVGKTDIKAKKSGKNGIKLSCKAVENAKGYQFAYAKNKKFKDRKKVDTSKRTLALKSLKKGTYYVKVRAYRKDSAGERVYGKWSKTEKCKL